MSQLLNFKRGVARLCKLRILVPEVENLRHIMPRKTAFALIFCSGASLLFGQEQSATALSHQVKDIFERAAKAAGAAIRRAAGGEIHGGNFQSNRAVVARSASTEAAS